MALSHETAELLIYLCNCDRGYPNIDLRTVAVVNCTPDWTSSMARWIASAAAYRTWWASCPKKVDLYLHQQSMDTTTPAGKALFQMMGVFAEFERAMIQERVKAGLERAWAQGKQLGRPTVSADVEPRIAELRAGGLGKLKIARTLGIGVSTVQRVVG